MKRFLSFIIVLCLLLSLVIIPAAAVTNDDGYGITVSGFDQAFSVAGTLETGLWSYNGHVLPSWPDDLSGDYYCCLIYREGTYLSPSYRLRMFPKTGHFEFKTGFNEFVYVPDTVPFNYILINDIEPGSTEWPAYTVRTVTSVSSLYTGIVQSSATLSCDVVWSNFDLVHGDTVYASVSGDPVPYFEDLSSSIFFPSSSYLSATYDNTSFSVFSETVSGSATGDLLLDYYLSSPYVDVTFPASFFGVNPSSDYNTLSLRGRIAQSAAFGMQAELSNGVTCYANTDIYIDSVQILLDDVAVTDQIDLNCNSPPASGISLSDSGITYTDTSCIFDSSMTYSISPFETVTYRFYLTNTSGLSSRVLSINGAAYGDCLINAFAYVSFSQLPAFVTSYVEPEDPEPEPSEDPDPGTSEDPDPGTSEDPDPGTSEDPDPDVPGGSGDDSSSLAGDGLSILGAIIPAAWDLLSFEIPGLGVSCKVFVTAILLINLSIAIAHFAFGFGGSGTGYRSGSGGKKQISEKRKGDEK